MINTLSARLRELLGHNNISIIKFAEMCDLPFETVKNIYYGKTPDPKISTILKMANTLKISVNCLMGQCQHTTQEKIILNNYRKCGEHGKKIIEFTAKYKASVLRDTNIDFANHNIPCIVTPDDIKGGIVYNMCERIEIETNMKDAYFAIKLQTNDFVPSFCKGDVLLFKHQFPKNGQHGAFIIGEKIYVRKYIEESSLYIIKSLYDASENITLTRLDNIEYIGTYCGLIRV